MGARSKRRRVFRRPRLSPSTILVIVLAVTVLRIVLISGEASEPRALAEGEYQVRYVVDGDTFVLANDARVRLQGIDTPEAARDDLPAEPWSEQATAFTRAFVDDAGGAVRLTFGAERKDRYGRRLAFAWRGEAMLNEELVRQGLARARPDFRFSGRMKRRLLEAESQAKEARRGIWSE